MVHPTRHSAVLNRHYALIKYCGRSLHDRRKLERMQDVANLLRVALCSQAGFGVLIGESAPMHFLYARIENVAF